MSERLRALSHLSQKRTPYSAKYITSTNSEFLYRPYAKWHIEIEDAFTLEGKYQNFLSHIKNWSGRSRDHKFAAEYANTAIHRFFSRSQGEKLAKESEHFPGDR